MAQDNSFEFVHLHVHDTYSLLDSVIKIDPLVARCKELGMKAICQSNHGTISGSIEFYNTCKKEGIKPLLGCECYLTEDPDDAEKKNRDNHHLVLIASSAAGWKNLIWLQNNAVLHNFYYKPRINRQLLETHNEGLIATSACLASPLSKALDWQPEDKRLECLNPEKYLRLVHWFADIFQDRFYLEVQPHTFWEQRAYNNFLILLARQEGIPLVVTTDAHFLRREDFETHELMMAMQLKTTLENYRAAGKMRYDRTTYLQTPAEIDKWVTENQIPDAAENTLLIADQCNLELSFGQSLLPEYRIEEENDYKEFQKWSQNKIS